MREDPARVEGSSPARAGEAARALIRGTRQDVRIGPGCVMAGFSLGGCVTLEIRRTIWRTPRSK